MVQGVSDWKWWRGFYDRDFLGVCGDLEVRLLLRQDK